MKEPRREIVLLVEDDPNDQLLVQRAFRKAGFTAPLEIVGDGDAAVAYLSSEGPYAAAPRPGLVLLDLKLPRRSGLEVLAWAKGQEGLRRTPIVVLTSSSDSGDLARAYDLGVNSYLTKPVEFEALLAMVQALGLYWLGWNEPSPA